MSMQATPPASGPARSRARLLLAVATVAVLAIAILVIATLATGREPGNTSPTVRSTAEHSIGAQASGQQQGRFEISSGAETLVVRCQDLGADLYRASTPPDGSLVPQATQNADTIQLTLVASGSGGAASAEVLLSSAVTWELRMAGGGLNQKIECATGKLSAVELGQGAGTIDVTLPPAKGTVPVRLAGGAGDLKVHLPKGLPAQVKIAGGAGAGSLSVDGVIKSDVKPGTEVTPADWTAAADRYTIEAMAGLASLTVDRG